MYTHKVFESRTLPNAENLDELDRQGWEVIQVLPEHGRYFTYARRPKQGGGH